MSRRLDEYFQHICLSCCPVQVPPRPTRFDKQTSIRLRIYISLYQPCYHGRVSPCVFVSLQGTLMFSLSSTDADVRVFILSSPGRLVAGGCLGGATKDHHVSPATSSIQQRPSASLGSHLDRTVESVPFPSHHRPG